MKKIINLLRGYAEWKVTGAFPERMLNLCARHRLPFWHLRWLDGTTFTFRTALSRKSQTEELARRSMCELTLLARRGAGAAALSLGRRWGFLIGLALCLFTAGFLSRFLLHVEVVGCRSVAPAVILTELRRLGVHPGAYGPSIDEQAIANKALLTLPDLSYMVINIHGTRAEVIVEEAIAPPELLDENTPADLVAAADGIIIDFRTDSGRALLKEGDIVAKGEVLITGMMDLQEPVGGTVDLGYLAVRAAGSVRARTWRTLEESIPLTTGKKVYTGEETVLRSVKILWGRLDFFKNSSISYERYDKISCTRMLTVGRQEMPLGLTTVTIREYTVDQAPLDVETAEAQLTQILEARLAHLMDAGEGTVLRTDLVRRMDGGLLTVTLLAECEEEIGRIVELPGETGHIPKE